MYTLGFAASNCFVEQTSQKGRRNFFFFFFSRLLIKKKHREKTGDASFACSLSLSLSLSLVFFSFDFGENQWIEITSIARSVMELFVSFRVDDSLTVHGEIHD